jgi:NADPH-dependent 2,4-dienoyl-CoA reductase/sulfur reductase-like enzyme
MAEPPHGTVIVGASVAGLHAAEQLRAAGYRHAIDLIDAETRLPYDRPPLSKGVLLGKATHDDIRLHGDDALAALDLGLHLGVRATGLRDRTVQCADGREFTGRHVILATGLSSRPLPGQPGLHAQHAQLGHHAQPGRPAAASVRTLRTLDDALALRERMLAGSSIAIIGAGLIGCEVASAGRDLGLDVTVVEALPAPMARAVGGRAGAMFARLLRDRGVRLLTSARVQSVDADDDRAEITLADGAVITADTVLVAIGSVLNTGWLGPMTTGEAGLICDTTGQVAGHDGLYAVGDIASWPDPVTGGHRRQEHWMSARTQAAAVAALIAGQEPAPPKPDYAWTDQFGLLIQILGRPELADTTVHLEEKVLGYFAQERIVGALIVGAPRRKGPYSRLIAAGAPLGEFAEAAAGSAEPFA